MNILIIGATSAIASACAKIWANNESKFFLVARDLEKLTFIADDLKVRGAEVECFELNVVDIKQQQQMLTKSLAFLHNIDIALIDHGTLPNQAECEKNIAMSLREFNINAVATITLLSQLANIMERQSQGSLAVISSVAGDRGRPSNYVYGSAKAAVSTFCEGLRARLFKKKVYLTDIKPGFVDTPMTQNLSLPQVLVSSPEKIAHCIVKGIKKHKNVIYAPKFWFFIMFIIKNIPNVIFKRINL